MKILIATVSISLNWVRKEMVEAIKNLVVHNDIVDWIVLTEQLEDSELYTHTQWSVGKTIANNVNKAREFALKNGYDYMFVVESDIIVPENALTSMLECNADIVSALVPERISKVGKNILNIYYNGIKDAERLCREGKPFKVDEGPIGRACLLISRRALEHPFQPSDGIWCDAMRGQGFQVIIDPRVKCSHVDRDGRIMHAIINQVKNDEDLSCCPKL